MNAQFQDDVKIPRGEKLWVSVLDAEQTRRLQIVTSNTLRTKYYLYNVDSDGKLTKIETNDNPMFKNMKV